MLNGKRTLFIDQYGVVVSASTLKELVQKVGGGKAGKMFVDKKDGTTAHIGYVIGDTWLQAYAPIEEPT